MHQLGGYKVQRDEEQLLIDARAAERPALRHRVGVHPGHDRRQNHTAAKIPTIGIGAGADCDGQVLVTQRLLGLTSGYVPRFVKAYADLGQTITDAVTRFRDDVRQGKFPGPEHTFR